MNLLKLCTKICWIFFPDTVYNRIHKALWHGRSHYSTLLVLYETVIYSVGYLKCFIFLFKHFTVHIEHGRKTAIANECELIARYRIICGAVTAEKDFCIFATLSSTFHWVTWSGPVTTPPQGTVIHLSSASSLRATINLRCLKTVTVCLHLCQRQKRRGRSNFLKWNPDHVP